MIDDKALLAHWHVVGLSSDLAKEPLQVELMDERVVLWRQDTKILAFRDLCIHRGTALSLGKIEDGCLVCPYHGWRYDTSGQCVHIPAQGKLGDPQTIPEKARAHPYTATERYGLIWLTLDENPKHDIPHYPEFEEAGFKTITCGPYEINAQAPRVIENFLDVSHLMWVHEGLLGVPSHAEIPEYHVHESGDKLVTDTIRIFQPDPDGRGKVVNNDYIYSVFSPMTAHFRKTDSTSPEVFAMMLQTSPIADGKTKAYILLSRNYAFETYDSEPQDATFQAFQDKVFSQDEVIVQSQRPELLPLDLREELHLMSDRLAIAYRRYLEKQGVTTGVA